MSHNPEYREVHMKMRASTVDKVNKLQESLNVNTRTDAVKTAIDVTEMVAKTIKSGGQVILEKKDGSRSKIIIPNFYGNE